MSNNFPRSNSNTSAPPAPANQQGQTSDDIAALLSAARAASTRDGGVIDPHLLHQFAMHNQAVATHMAAQQAHHHQHRHHQGHHGHQGGSLLPPGATRGSTPAHPQQHHRPAPGQSPRLAGMLVGSTEAMRTLALMKSLGVSPGATALAAAVLPSAALPKTAAAVSAAAAAAANQKPSSQSARAAPASFAPALQQQQGGLVHNLHHQKCRAVAANAAASGSGGTPSSAGPSNASKRPDPHSHPIPEQPHANAQNVNNRNSRSNMLRSYGEENPLFYERLVQLVGKKDADEMVREAVDETIKEEVELNGGTEIVKVAARKNGPANYREQDVISIADSSEEEEDDEPKNHPASQIRVVHKPPLPLIPKPKTIAQKAKEIAQQAKEIAQQAKDLPAKQAQVFPPPTKKIATAAKASPPLPANVAVAKVAEVKEAVAKEAVAKVAVAKEAVAKEAVAMAVVAKEAVAKESVAKVVVTTPKAAPAPVAQAMHVPFSQLLKSATTAQDSKKRKADGPLPPKKTLSTVSLANSKRANTNPKAFPIPSPEPVNDTLLHALFGKPQPPSTTASVLTPGLDGATATAPTTTSATSERRKDPPGFNQFKADPQFCRLLFESAKSWKQKIAGEKSKQIGGLFVQGLLNIDDEQLNPPKDRDPSIPVFVKDVITPYLNIPSKLAESEGQWETCIRISSDNVNEFARTIVYQRRKAMKSAVKLALYEIDKNRPSCEPSTFTKETKQKETKQDENKKDKRIKELQQQLASERVKHAKKIKELGDEHFHENKECEHEYTEFVSKLLKSHRKEMNDLKRGVRDMQTVHKTFLESYVEASVDALRNNNESPML